MDYSASVSNTIDSLSYFIPELALAGLILVLVIADLILGKERSAWLSIVSVIGYIVVFAAVLGQYGMDSRSIFNDMLAVDPFSLFFKLLFLASAIAVVFLSIASVELAGRPVGEYFTLMAALVLGMFLMSSATNLLTIYLSIEFVSIVSFVLSAYLKTRLRSSEAGLKYAIYGAFSSGLMLYGLSLLYGLTGTFNIYEIGTALAVADSHALTLWLAVILIMAGFGYKIAAVPFHFWSPDVYEGAPTPITAFLSIGPKAAGFAMLMRFFNVAMASTTGDSGSEWSAAPAIDWPGLLAVISAVTMTLGNLVAVVQKNVKRLLAYSSIAHAGYILMATVVLSEQGIFSAMFYLVVYYFMNLGAFLCVIIFQDLAGSERIDDYKGLGYRAPVPAIAMTIFLVSLTGIPPFAGFIGKVYLFSAVIKGDTRFYWLVVVAVLNSAVSLYYYARIIKAMFLEKAGEETSTLPVSAFYLTMLTVLTVPTVLFGIYFTPLIRLANYSIQFLRTL